MRFWICLFLVSVTGFAAEPIKVKVTFQSKQQLEFEIIGRESGNIIMMREPGKTAEIGFPVRDFAKVDFGLTDDLKKIDAKLVAQDYNGAADDLVKLLDPFYPYLDLPSKVADSASLLMRLLINTGRFDEAVTTSYRISRYVKDEALRREAQAYRAVGLLELSRFNTLDGEMKGLAGTTRKDDIAGPYFYVLGQQSLIKSNYPAAHLAASQIIAFRPRDFEWMPAGLYLSAKCYIADGKLPVAEQIITEINTAYPKSRWAEMATKLAPDIAQRRQELEKAKPKE